MAILQIQCASRILAPTEGGRRAPTIRVLLLESPAMEIKLRGRYALNIRTSEDLTRLRDQVIGVGVRGQRVVLTTPTGRELGSGNPVIFSASGGGQSFEMQGRRFAGGIAFQATAGQLQAVNHLDLESYIKGVVPAEMGRRKKLDFEALKAQAIASRTYAFKKMEGRGAADHYDVRSDVSDQVYHGRDAASTSTDDAVDATFGQVITYKNKPILSFYHSTCGGRTASASEVFALARSPYLTGVADNFGDGDFCRISPHYRWTSVFSQADIMKRLRHLAANSSKGRSISDIRIDHRLPSGRVFHLSAGTGNERVTVSSMQVRELFQSDERPLLRSSLFRILPPGSSGTTTHIKLLGAGSGHGVGMCQWGAIGMSREGYEAAQILQHYYRDTTLTRAY